MKPLPSFDLSLSLQFGLAGKTDKPLDIALHRTALPRHKVQRWIKKTLEMGQPSESPSALQSSEITVRIVGNLEAQALNQSYRQRDYATNVLTFDYSRAPFLAADLVLCAPVVAQEAADNACDLQAHYAHLLVHGTLHALGHDHEGSDAEATAMEALESQILQRLGFADPYASDATKAGFVTKPAG